MNGPTTLKPRALLIALIAVLLALPAVAGARECADFPDMVARLKAEHGERPAGAGLAGTDRVMDIFISPETGRWTVTETGPDGRACIVIRGRHFQTPVKPVARGEVPA